MERQPASWIPSELVMNVCLCETLYSPTSWISFPKAPNQTQIQAFPFSHMSTSLDALRFLLISVAFLLSHIYTPTSSTLSHINSSVAHSHISAFPARLRDPWPTMLHTRTVPNGREFAVMVFLPNGTRSCHFFLMWTFRRHQWVFFFDWNVVSRQLLCEDLRVHQHGGCLRGTF